METSKQSTGETLFDLTLYVADTPANHSATQASAEARTTHATYGLGLETPLANYDQDTQSWKMYGDTYLWGDSPLLENLPVSGMTLNGVLYPQPVWEPITDETELSLWPTPTAVTRPMEGNVRIYRAKIEAGEMTEAEAEAILGKSVWAAQGAIPMMWPTPTTQEVEHPEAQLTETGRRKSKNGNTSHSIGLADAVLLWPTPTANGWGSTGHRAMLDKQITQGFMPESDKLPMTAGNGGRLNPTWVEWLMGFPTGWTDLED
jgi:hypothetical protein